VERPKVGYPLTWPAGQPRTKSRKRSPFKVTFGKALDELIWSLRQLGAADIVISSNVPTKRDGLPYADEDDYDEPGVSLWFNRKNKPFVIACDAYRSPRDNIRALGLTIDALRSIERHGSASLMEQAFTGFTALPAHAAEPSWYEVLGVAPTAPIDEIKAAYRRLAFEAHPDRGGAEENMKRINVAYQSACRDLGVEAEMVLR
jgi:hypothetical protein